MLSNIVGVSLSRSTNQRYGIDTYLREMLIAPFGGKCGCAGALEDAEDGAPLIVGAEVANVAIGLCTRSTLHKPLRGGGEKEHKAGSAFRFPFRSFRYWF